MEASLFSICLTFLLLIHNSFQILYDKTDDCISAIKGMTNFPQFDSGVPTAPAYGE